MTRNHPMEVAQADLALHFLKLHEKSSVVSPLSIATTLAMVYAGADGATKNEIHYALAREVPEQELHAFFKRVLSQTGNAAGAVTVEMANKVYVQDNYKLLHEYETFIAKKYGGDLENVDFANSAKTAETINAWVEKATHEKIKDLIDPSLIDSLTRMVLVNAAYLKGSWKRKFDAERTDNELFYQAPGLEKEVRMMNIRGKFDYSENDAAQALCLPYSNESFAMYVVLPKERFGLRQFTSDVRGEELFALMDKCITATVEVKLPQFKIETSLELTDALKKAGINHAFQEASADFSKMTGNRDLYVSDVVHKAFVEVNEEGTEAAAATAVTMRLRCMPMAPPMVVTFHANHGFLYFIVNTTSKGILFAGSFQ